MKFPKGKMSFGQKCIRLKKLREKLSKNSIKRIPMIMKSMKSNQELMRLTHSSLNQKGMEKNLKEQKLILKQFIIEKREKKRIKDKEEGRFNIQDRPDFALVGKKRKNRNWLDLSYNPKITIELTKKISERLIVDEFMNKIEELESEKIFEKLKKGILKE